MQTAEGALNEVHAILQRVRELAVQYDNGTLSQGDRGAISAEIRQLSAEVFRIANSTTFNQINLLGGNSTITFQVGANSGETITMSTIPVFGGTGAAIDPAIFQFGATNADITAIDLALSSVADARAGLGAIQNRLEHTVNNLAVYHENLSRVGIAHPRRRHGGRDEQPDAAADPRRSRGTAMLAQANQTPAGRAAAVAELIGC